MFQTETTEPSNVGDSLENAFREKENARSGARRNVNCRRKTGDRCLQRPGLASDSGREIWKDGPSESGLKIRTPLEEKDQPEPRHSSTRAASSDHEVGVGSSDLSTECEVDMEEFAKDSENGSVKSLAGSDGNEQNRSAKNRHRTKGAGAKDVVPIRLRRLKLSQKLQEWKKEEDIRIRDALNRVKSSAVSQGSLETDPTRSPRNESFRSRKFSLPLLADSSKGSQNFLSPRARKVSDVRYRRDLTASPELGSDLVPSRNRAPPNFVITRRQTGNWAAKSDRAISLPPNSGRGESNSPKGEQEMSSLPKRAASISPKGNRMASASPTDERVSPDKERHVSTTSKPALDLRVQDFLSKEQPKAPASTLRTTEARRAGAARSKPAPGPRRALNESRMKGRVIINTDASPSLNEFQDRSWYYQDKSGKCRYLRVPESPPPPISWVFEKDET